MEKVSLPRFLQETPNASIHSEDVGVMTECLIWIFLERI